MGIHAIVRTMLLSLPALVSQTASKKNSRILTAWFPTRERGTWWGFWTASNNIGGFAAPLIAGGAANRFGWRWVSHLHSEYLCTFMV
jgi:sugar phosphate permease